MSVPIKRSDWVVCRVDPDGPVGLVLRVGKKGGWCDVDWRTHRKRMRTEHLLVKTEIRVGDMIVEDCTRAAELAAEKEPPR